MTLSYAVFVYAGEETNNGPTELKPEDLLLEELDDLSTDDNLNEIMHFLEESEHSNNSQQYSAEKNSLKNGVFTNAPNQPTVNNNTITPQQQQTGLMQSQQRGAESTSPIQPSNNMSSQSQVRNASINSTSI